MDKAFNLDKILARLKTKSPASSRGLTHLQLLEPFTDEILSLARVGAGSKEIQIFLQLIGVEVMPGYVFQFLQAHDTHLVPADFAEETGFDAERVREELLARYRKRRRMREPQVVRIKKLIKSPLDVHRDEILALLKEGGTHAEIDDYLTKIHGVNVTIKTLSDYIEGLKKRENVEDEILEEIQAREERLLRIKTQKEDSLDCLKEEILSLLDEGAEHTEVYEFLTKTHGVEVTIPAVDAYVQKLKKARSVKVVSSKKAPKGKKVAAKRKRSS